MIFNKIMIQNFGPFLDTNEIVTKIVDDKNVSIIHGQNYVGKTSVLRAIIWCLYGEVIPDDKNNAVEILNSQAKEDCKYQTSVAIEFVHDNKNFSIERISERKYLANGKEDILERFSCFEIDKSGHHSPIVKAQDFINELAPPLLSKFFFLKGENSPLNQTEHDLSQSMKEILGFDLIAKGLRDLVSVEGGFRRSSTQYVEDKELKSMVEKIDILEKDNEKESTRIIQYKENIQSAKEQKKLCEDNLGEYQKLMGEKKHLKEIGKEIESQEQKLKDQKTKNALWFRKNLFSVVSLRLTKSGMKNINTDIANGKLPSPYQENFIDEILERGRCIFGSFINNDSHEYYSIK
jgi:DNA sulfur modification protein DndD